MAATFPTSPTNGQTAVVNNITYVYASATSSWTRVLGSANNISNGTTNVTIASAGSNATVSVSGTSNVAVFASTGEYVTGVVSASGNITSAGNISGTYILGNGSQLTGISVAASYGNSNVAAYLASGTNTSNVVTTGNVSGGNLLTSGQMVSTLSTGTAPFVITSTTKVINLNVEQVDGYHADTANTVSTIAVRDSAANITAAAYNGTGVSVSGNVAGGNVIATTIVSAASHIGSVVSVTGAITGAGITGTSLTVSTGNITGGNIVNAGANGVGNIGTVGGYFNTVFAKATSAQYADVAEWYSSDQFYEPGTVVAFGGAEEVTLSSTPNDNSVAGVVSTNPAYIMNAGIQAEHSVPVALTGRVPTKVIGPVRKGNMMVSAGNGHAQACSTPAVGTVIGKAIENFDGKTGVIEVVVGRV